MTVISIGRGDQDTDRHRGTTMFGPREKTVSKSPGERPWEEPALPTPGSQTPASSTVVATSLWHLVRAGPGQEHTTCVMGSTNPGGARGGTPRGRRDHCSLRPGPAALWWQPRLPGADDCPGHSQRLPAPGGHSGWSGQPCAGELIGDSPCLARLTPRVPGDGASQTHLPF